MMDEVLPGLADGLVWPDWLSRRETSEYLRKVHGVRMGSAALANAALKGTRPIFQKDGRLCVYWRPHIDEYARTRKSRPVRSTSELRGTQPPADVTPTQGA